MRSPREPARILGNGLASSLLYESRAEQGPDWLPRRLEVEASAKDWAGKRPEFAGEALIEFDAKRTGIELPSSSLDRRLHSTGSDLAADLHSDSHESPAVDLKGSLQQALRSIASCERQLTLELGAEISCVSERSLQRNLSGEGTSWREIVDRVHFETALDLMSDRTNSLADIAATLGYSQYPHFYRAFQRWTGESPSAYMKRLAP